MVTATTDPIRVAPCREDEVTHPNSDHFTSDDLPLQIADNAGPHLILACSHREWSQTPDVGLDELLKSLQTLPLKRSLKVLIHEGQVILLPETTGVLSPEELKHYQSVIEVVVEIQSRLDETLPSYSGIVVIPSPAELIAALH